MELPGSDNLIWIDLEMTGLDTANDVILEIATVVTSSELELLAQGPNLAIYQEAALLAGMDEWNTRQHGQSGLIDRVRGSSIDTFAAEQQTLSFLRSWVPAGRSPMCGNSICQDRRFLARLMPELEAYFHYRNLDVSTLKELARRWMPGLAAPKKTGTHLALDDVLESIEELRYYREHLIRPGQRKEA